MKIRLSWGSIKAIMGNGAVFGVVCNVVAFVAVAGWRRGLVGYAASFVAQALGGAVIGYVFARSERAK